MAFEGTLYPLSDLVKDRVGARKCNNRVKILMINKEQLYCSSLVKPLFFHKNDAAVGKVRRGINHQKEFATYGIRTHAYEYSGA